MQPVTLAQLMLNVRPTNLLILLILFLALLRKLGWLPPEKDDDSAYTNLGLDAGFAAAVSDAKAYVTAHNPPSPQREAMLYQIDYLAGKYRTGNVTLS